MIMDVLKIAREAGLAVLLDGKIGQQDYNSISGTKDSLQAFVEAIRNAMTRENGLRARLRLRTLSSPPSRWRGKHGGTRRLGI
jgi:hypothetical protein